MDCNHYCNKIKNNFIYCNNLLYKNSNESLILTNKIYNLAFYINQPNCTYIKQDPNAPINDQFRGEKLPKIIRVSNNLNNSFNNFEDYLSYKKSSSMLENNFKTI